MKIMFVVVSVCAVLGISDPSHAVTINWVSNLEGDNAAFPSSDPVNSATFGSLSGVANPDFRIMNLGLISGEGEKAVSAGVAWTFGATGVMTGVAGSDTTPGCSDDCTTDGGVYSADEDGGVGLLKNAFFLVEPMGFLAPVLGSPTADAYGAGQLNHDGVSDAFGIHFAVLEMQWAGGAFTPGLSNGGVDFNCSGAASGSIECFGEIQLAYDDDNYGFVGQYFQWHLTGTTEAFASPVPLPAAFWLLGSGIAVLLGAGRRRRYA